MSRPSAPTPADRLRALIPNAVPDFSDEEVTAFTGIDPSEIGLLNFPHPEARVMTFRPYGKPNAPALAYAKGIPVRGKWLPPQTGPWFALTRQSDGSPIWVLVEIDEADVPEAVQTLNGGSPIAWYAFLQRLPTTCLVATYPSEKLGLARLQQIHAATTAEHQLLEALSVQVEIVVEASHAALALAQRLLRTQPVVGNLKFDALTQPLEETRHGLPHHRRMLGRSTDRRATTARALHSESGSGTSRHLRHEDSGHQDPDIFSFDD